jgi:hypothetical protein
MKRHLLGVAVAVLGTAVLSGIGLQSASAADPVPADPAVAVPNTVTLPLFGVPFTIDITTGPGGALTDVTVDPASLPNTTATQLRPHKVVFESANPADPTSSARVVVRSRKGGQSVSARAGSLGQVSGPGMWSGDLFGDGTASSVAFTVVDGGAAGPDITGITTTGATAGTPTVSKSTDTDEDGTVEMEAKASVKFTNTAGDESRSITIKVASETAADGTTEAKLSISLGRIKGVAVDAAAAAGPHTWTGMLCDSSTATIDYVVAADGSISDVVATPDTGDVRVHGHKIDARFSHDERVRIEVREHDGLITINVDERIKCDSADPTTNAATTSTVADDDDANENENEANHHGGHGHDDEDTTTTVAPATGA